MDITDPLLFHKLTGSHFVVAGQTVVRMHAASIE
jgi:hypothetical protein